MFNIVMIFVCIAFLALNATDKNPHPLTPVSNTLWTISLVLNILILMGVI